MILVENNLFHGKKRVKNLQDKHPYVVLNTAHVGEVPPDCSVHESVEAMLKFSQVHMPDVENIEPVPDKVTNAQFRAALIDAGVMPAQIDAAIAAIPDAIAREKARQWWDYANEFERCNSLIATLAPAFGLTDAQVDDLFRAAARQK